MLHPPPSPFQTVTFRCSCLSPAGPHGAAERWAQGVGVIPSKAALGMKQTPAHPRPGNSKKPHLGDAGVTTILHHLPGKETEA